MSNDTIDSSSGLRHGWYDTFKTADRGINPVSREESQQARAFEQAGKARRATLVGECWAFLKQNKKWWLAPIVVTLLVIGLVVATGGVTALQFLYPLF